MAKMGGRWTPLPDEVIELLAKETPSCFVTYALMLKRFLVEHVTDTEGIWVAGRIHATRYEVASKVAKSVGNFYDNIWPRWKEIGIAEIKDGGIYLPMIYRKGQEPFDPQQMQKEIDELRAWQSKMQYEKIEMQKTMQKLLALLSKSQDVITTIPSSERKDPSSERKDPSSERKASSLLIDKEKKISLSNINKVITGFYRGIGRNRISKVVRNKAIAIFQELQEEGYLPGQIIYATLWIPQNADEPIKHFGIVPHMIDQAIEAGKKELEAQEAREALEKARQEAERNRLSEQEEREALARYKAQLSEEDREELRNDALLKLRGTPGIKSDMIVDALIEVQENELIRESGVDLSAFRDRDIEGSEEDGETSE